MNGQTLTGPPALEQRPHRASRTPFPRLARVELRKTVDTRGGRLFLAGLGLLMAAVLLYRFSRAHGQSVLYDRFLQDPLTVLRQLLPVLGALAMTSEWTQRTALATFALVPRRGRVVAAKFLACAALSAVAVLLAATASAAAAAGAAAVGGIPVQWDGPVGLVGGAVAATVLAVMLGAALGSLVQQTAPAVVAVLLAPSVVSAAAVAAFGDPARWVDVVTALHDVGRLSCTDGPAPVATALLIWVLLPAAAGTLRTLRRDVE